MLTNTPYYVSPRSLSYVPEWSDLQVDQSACLQVHQLVVVARGEGILGQTGHGVLQTHRVEQIATDEHPTDAVEIC